MPETIGPQQNLYESAEKEGHLLEVEADRLRSLDYPAECSIDAIGDMAGRMVCDIGAGNNESLGRKVREQGGTYLAFDIRQDAVAEQIAYGSLGAIGTIDQLPLADRSVEVSHGRFVVGHIGDPERRSHAISEVIRVASEEAILIDYDWAGWQGSEAMNDFKAVAQSIASRRGFNPGYGAELRDEVQNNMPGADVTEKRYQREPGQYYGEIIGLAGALHQQAEQIGDADLLDRLDQATARVKAEAGRPDSPDFTTPDIVAVTVKR